MPKKQKLIQSLSRAFSIIDCFSEEVKTLTLNEISEKVDLNINTTRGLVQTLVHYNYLSYDKYTRRYRLGSIFLEKAEIARYDFTEKIIQMISGDLQRIADQYAVSTRFHSVENLSITTIIERQPSRSRYVLEVHKQTDFPLYASASGKLILAHISDAHLEQVLNNTRWEKYGKSTITTREVLEEELLEIKQNGVSMEKDELGDGYSSVAIPVFKDEKLVYTLAAVSTTQLIEESYDDLLTEIRKVREKIYELSEFQ